MGASVDGQFFFEKIPPSVVYIQNAKECPCCFHIDFLSKTTKFLGLK